MGLGALFCYPNSSAAEADPGRGADPSGHPTTLSFFLVGKGTTFIKRGKRCIFPRLRHVLLLNSYPDLPPNQNPSPLPPNQKPSMTLPPNPKPSLLTRNHPRPSPLPDPVHHQDILLSHMMSRMIRFGHTTYLSMDRNRE